MRIFFRFTFVFLSICFFWNHAPTQPVAADSLRILAIRVEFEEDDAGTTTGNGKFDLSSPVNINQIDPPPHNRSYFQDHLVFLGNYFRKITDNHLWVEGDVFPLEETAAYQLTRPMTYYNPNRTPDENNTGLARLFNDAVVAADQDPAIDFSRYQGVIIFHAGVGKDVDLGYDETPQDIPSLFITPQFLQTYLGISGIPVEGGSREVSQGMIAPETESQAGIELGLNGILTSNFGSLLGWMDLFSPVTRRSGIGRFGLMDAGLFNGDGLLPALPCAWTRIDGGLIQPIDISYAGGDEFTIYSTLSGGSEKVYRIPINAQEYFLIENRYSGDLNFDSLRLVLAQGRSDYPTAKEVLLTYYPGAAEFSPRGVLIDVTNPDIGLSGNGCLIWHIDERIIAANRAVNRINADPEHRGVDLEEADGSQDIGEAYDFLSPGYGSEIGWVLDMWYEGNSSPVFSNEFSVNSTPNSRSYDNRANSHIKIFEFSEADSVMTFRVTSDILQQNFPVQIPVNNYGRITSMKTMDLDFDGKGEVIMTTDQGRILITGESGRSMWGSDSFQVALFDQDLITPPVFFVDDFGGSPQRTSSMIAMSQSGKIFGLQFHSNHSVSPLLPQIRISSFFTTHPVSYDRADSSVTILAGAENGFIYMLHFSAASTILDSLPVSDEPIRFVHVENDRQMISITASGRVYRNEQFLENIPLPAFPPAGDQAVGVTGDGEFLVFKDLSESFAEGGIFRFDSPPVINPFSGDESPEPQMMVSGNNRLYYFNYNFTMQDNYPVRLYDPDRPVPLPLSPLINRFYDAGWQETIGAITTEPAGILDGFDLSGKRLADFPIAAGDSILVSPVILDIDDDGDLDIAAATGSGLLYVWDLPSTFEPNGWNQIYSDALNSNRVINRPAIPVHDPDPVNAGYLLPEDQVYNWPNPNIENYTFIRYFLRDPADVKIKIFDLAGDLVAEFQGTAYPGTSNEVRWELSGVQSGVYLGQIEAKNSQVSEIRFIKIAVIK